MNIICIFHAYKFTHFSYQNALQTKNPNQLSIQEKIESILLGVSNPIPIDLFFPKRKFKNVTLGSSEEINCWEIRVEDSKGMIALFHGFGASKSSLLNESEVFNKLGYSTILVDLTLFDEDEAKTTIGYYESKIVKKTCDYISKENPQKMFLYGFSMGAVAIMKAVKDYNIKADGLILGSPFGSMLEAVESRFELMNIPSFPMANLLVFWGGTINGFWGFEHSPKDYAKSIKIPTLLMYGKLDTKVNKGEVEEIFENLNCKKDMVEFQNSGHESYLNNNKNEFISNIEKFF